jgi:hypothetical protein
MKPHVICHMMVSLDGRIHPSRWTASPDGRARDDGRDEQGDPAPARDRRGGGVTGVFEVPEATGLAGKVRLRFVGSEELGSGVVRLRHVVDAGDE